MKLRMKSIVIACMLIVFSIPVVLYAQEEELTLAGLAEQIAALTARVDKLESVFAVGRPVVDERGCTLVKYAPGDAGISSIKIPLVQVETMVSYRDKFSQNLEELDIVQVDLSEDGTITISYTSEHDYDDYTISEVFQGCEFIHLTEWSELDD